MQPLLNNYGSRYRMIIGGIAASSRNNPRVVEHMLEAFYKPWADST
ncbi:MAG: hypothetical protein VX911_05155 [Candidatus Latescibacterota bacterium]|nr:hypothetical protein [Candidatus Latescibacterota bacterium]